MNIIAKKETTRVRLLIGTMNDYSLRYKQLKKSLKGEKHLLFAEPLKSGNFIVWRTPLHGKIENYKNLSSEKQETIDQLLAQQANEAKQSIKDPKLAKTISEYLIFPTKNDIYAIDTPQGTKVILTFWGCELDNAEGSRVEIKIDEKYPVPVVFLVKYTNGEIATGEKVFIEFNNIEKDQTADNHGKIDFGEVMTQTPLKAYQYVENQKRFVHNFTCDGRSEYIIEIPPLQTMKFKVEYSNGEIVTQTPIHFEYMGKNEEHITNMQGEIEIADVKAFSKVIAFLQDEKQRKHQHEFICEENQDYYKITLPAPEPEIEPPMPEPDIEHPEPRKIKVKIIDHKKRPVTDCDVEFNFKGDIKTIAPDENGYCELEYENIQEGDIIDTTIKVKKKKKTSKKRQ